ncbi:hypothetical protein Tco_1506710 [Tanacetum coccineum]
MDVDDEISNLVDLHMGMFDGGWKWQDLQGLLWLDHHKNLSLIGEIQVLMIDWLSIVETDKLFHTMETDIVKLVVEIKSFGMSSDEFDKETGSSNGLQPKQADLSCVHALNELHLHEIRVVPSKHKADQC